MVLVANAAFVIFSYLTNLCSLQRTFGGLSVLLKMYTFRKALVMYVVPTAVITRCCNRGSIDIRDIPDRQGRVVHPRPEPNWEIWLFINDLSVQIFA